MTPTVPPKKQGTYIRYIKLYHIEVRDGVYGIGKNPGKKVSKPLYKNDSRKS